LACVIIERAPVEIDESLNLAKILFTRYQGKECW
jgi:hypothetical protein